MKLRDKPLDWWKGRSFRYWCRADSKDERKIHYTFNWYSIGQGHTVEKFTSDDMKDCLTLYRLQNIWIHDLKLIDNEWHVELDYPFYYA